LRHGLRSSALPDGCKYISLQRDKLRRQLEDAVLAARGKITLSDASLISTACEWSQHAALAKRWLRLQGDKLKPMELLNFSREAAKASSERDKAIAALNLDRDITDDLLYGRTPRLLPAPKEEAS
jgi:hypothetical protein